MQQQAPSPNLSRVYEYTDAILRPYNGQSFNLVIAPCVYTQDHLIEIYGQDDQPIDWTPSGTEREQVMEQVEKIAQQYETPISIRAASDHVVVSRVLESAEASDDFCLIDFSESPTITMGEVRGLGFRKICPAELEKNMRDAEGNPDGWLQLQAKFDGEVHEMRHEGTLSADSLENFEDFEDIIDEVEDLIEAVVDLHHNEDRTLRTATLSVLSRDPETGSELRSIYASCLIAAETLHIN